MAEDIRAAVGGFHERVQAHQHSANACSDTLLDYNPPMNPTDHAIRPLARRADHQIHALTDQREAPVRII